MPQISIKEFSGKIRALHPEYKDIPDSDLVKAYIGKHPEYKDAIEPEFTGSYRLLPSKKDSEPKSEPGTFTSGFTKSIKDQVATAGKNLKPALESAANPKTTGDILSLLIPSELNEGWSVGKDFLSRSKNAIEGTLRDSKSGILGRINPVKAIGRFNESLPSNQATDVLKFRGEPLPAVKPIKPNIMPNDPTINGYNPLDSFKRSKKPIAKSPSATSIVNDATKAEAAKPENVARVQALRDEFQSKASNVAPKPNTTFDPNTLFPPASPEIIQRTETAPYGNGGIVPEGITPTERRIGNRRTNTEPLPAGVKDRRVPELMASDKLIPDRRQSELLAKLGGRQGVNGPDALGAVGEVPGNTIPRGAEIDNATSKIAQVGANPELTSAQLGPVGPPPEAHSINTPTTSEILDSNFRRAMLKKEIEGMSRDNTFRPRLNLFGK